MMFLSDSLQVSTEVCGGTITTESEGLKVGVVEHILTFTGVWTLQLKLTNKVSLI